ncbi:hypothetical protein ACFQZZ_28750 [Nocardia sp. GCM10030253]|uniref:hypothetical protein n=1 Tax=Nocardia sp. GCM10030253 TaxID=3273404 RepID=UPI0036334C24
MKVLAIGRGLEVVNTAVAILQSHGYVAVGTTADDDALAELDTGEITHLIIGGGVEPDSREQLKKQAQAHGVTVHEAERNGRGIESYLEEVVIPSLHR